MCYAIITLLPARGHRPAVTNQYCGLAYNGRKTIFTVCNGEIYNHRELVGLVRQSGIALDLRSDVEVIPYIYELRVGRGRP